MEKKSHNQPTYVVGYEFTNVQGFKAKVVAYRGRKDIDIMFEDGAVFTGTTGSYIKKGYPLHPTFGKVVVGDRFPCKDGDTVEVVEYVSSTKVKARWDSDGAEKWTSTDTLKQGVNKHPTNWKLVVGDFHETNNNGRIEIVEYKNATDVVVRFEDGTLKKVTSAYVKSGAVAPDDLYQRRVGHKFTTNSGWAGEVIEWGGAFNVLVRWQDGSTSYHTWQDINLKSVKPLFQPSVSGVGYVGEGKYLPSSYKLEHGKQYADQRIYAYWQRMITRCYNEKEQQKPSCRAYIGCTVAEHFHNFQNFAEWAESKPQSRYTEGDKIWELDKDLLVSGNRVYSRDTCTFLPPEVNSFLSDRDWSETCPRGVNYIKPASDGAKEGWIARCHRNGIREYLGYYDSPMSAFYRYKEVKEAYAKELAERYKGRLEYTAYERLLAYTVEPYK